MYAITGATGNIGKAVVLELLSKGKKVRAIGRNAERLKELSDKGAETLIGDIYDSAFVQKAFAGCEAVFCLIPPNMQATDFKRDQLKVADNYVNAVKVNKIKYVLLLSSIGAHLRKGAGVVDGLGNLEERFTELKDVNVLNLRCGYFMENLIGQLEMIKQTGVVGSSIKANLPIPMVATKDIADYAAKLLLNLNFKGNTIEYILGPRDVSYTEATEIIARSIGKPDLKYVEFSHEDAKNGMIHAGFVSKNVAELIVSMAESINNGKAFAFIRTSENSSPTSVEDFIKLLKIKKRLTDQSA